MPPLAIIMSCNPGLTALSRSVRTKALETLPKRSAVSVTGLVMGASGSAMRSSAIVRAVAASASFAKIRMRSRGNTLAVL